MVHHSAPLRRELELEREKLRQEREEFEREKRERAAERDAQRARDEEARQAPATHVCSRGRAAEETGV